MKSENVVWNRRDFLKVGGTSTAALGVAGAAALPIQAGQAHAGTPPDTPYPKLSIITPYSPQKLAFAAQAGYEGVVITPGPDFNPNLSDSAIDQILATARDAGIRIVSIEYFEPNHMHPDAGKRSTAQADFIRALEFCHRLGCKFVGTFSGGQPGVSMEDQAAAFADVFNEKYLPVCEKLDRQRCRLFSTGSRASGWGWNSIPRIWSGFTLIPSVQHGSSKTVSSRCMRRIRRLLSLCCSRWALPDRDGGVIASPGRGL
jgi:hypothetical protein